MEQEQEQEKWTRKTVRARAFNVNVATVFIPINTKIFRYTAVLVVFVFMASPIHWATTN